MNWRGLTVAVVVVSAPMTGTGCVRTVSGMPQLATGGDPDFSRGYAFTDDRCGLLLDGTVQEMLGADDVTRAYSGAVCQYVLQRQSTVVDVMFTYFDSGTLERERAVAERSGAQISDLVVLRYPAFLARLSLTGNACSATAATDPGTITWWVQSRGDDAANPCEDAQNLLTRTLSSEM